MSFFGLSRDQKKSGLNEFKLRLVDYTLKTHFRKKPNCKVRFEIVIVENKIGDQKTGLCNIRGCLFFQNWPKLRMG